MIFVILYPLVIEVSEIGGGVYSVRVNQMQEQWYLFFISYQEVLEIGIIPLHINPCVEI